jgi:hypothetical protein
MTRATIAGGTLLIVLVLITHVAWRRSLDDVEFGAATSGAPATEAEQGFLYGRITTIGGATYQGRLRWGGSQEAFWGDYFNGSREDNAWAAHAPRGRLPPEGRPIEIFGFSLGRRDRPGDLHRRFMARFGDIVRIDASLQLVRVTLKSGSVVDLDRQSASDYDDGVRVWDLGRGVVDLEWIRSIEFLPTTQLGAVPQRLHGTVRTSRGDFTGFIQWDRDDCMGSDTIDGRTADREFSLRFETIRSIVRLSRDSSAMTLVDGQEIVLSNSREIGEGNRGIYVEDRRYGRVLISWESFERIEFSPRDSGPAYGDFPAGRPLSGSVTTRAGRRLVGRIVFDFDDSETTETLDGVSEGLDYFIPFGLIASIVLPAREEPGVRRARVTLQTGEALLFDGAGDLAETNAGMLIFVDGPQHPEYVPWSDVEQVDLERPPAMYPR